MKRAILSFTLLLGLAPFSPTMAQDDFGMWYEVSAEKKLIRNLNVSAEMGFRTRNKTRTADRLNFGVEAEYKIIKGLKISAGYSLLDYNNKEKLSLKQDNVRANKWTPSYWGLRHRVNVSLTGSINIDRLSISLRERWQYTYRPEVANKKYDIEEMTWEPVLSKHKHLLRSRIQLSYDFPHWKFDPFVNVELFNGWDLQKVRYQAGIEYKLRKQHTFALTYRYQDNRNDDELEADIHLIGLSYKFKF